MKIGIICIICEFFTVAGILYALVCGAKLQESLAGVLEEGDRAAERTGREK